MQERIQGWLAKVPGYSGYRSKEDRRDEDKRVRVAIAQEIDRVVELLTRTGSNLAAKRELDQIQTIESLIADTRHLGDRIRNATYGYGGIFTERSVDESALEQLRRFDLVLQRQVDTLSGLAATLGDQAAIDTYRTTLIDISDLFATRSQVIDEGRPSQDAKALELLKAPAEQKPSRLLGVKVGDALSVLGDNFTADATITLKVANATITLVRIGTSDGEGERWLMGSSAVDVWPTADLREVSSDTALVPVSTTSSPASLSLEGPQGKQGDVPASYALDAREDAITLEISMGGETRTFTGSPLNDIDIDVYGSTR
jgi:hypothetical protein